MSSTNLLTVVMHLCGRVALHTMRRRSDEARGNVIDRVIPMLLIPLAFLLLQRAIVRSPLLRLILWY